jgi:hypothetical protein
MIVDLTGKEQAVLRGLRDRGYAVIVWTPEELGDVNPEVIEDACIGYVADYFLLGVEEDE